MKPRRTHLSNTVFELVDGNEDNSLWLQREEFDGEVINRSCWEPSPPERAAIARGANIELCVCSAGHPPVAMAVVNTPLGKPPEDDDG